MSCSSVYSISMRAPLACTRSPRTQETGGSEVQGSPQLHLSETVNLKPPWTMRYPFTNKQKTEARKCLLITFAAWEDNPNFSIKKTLKLKRLSMHIRETYSFFPPKYKGKVTWNRNYSDRAWGTHLSSQYSAGRVQDYPQLYSELKTSLGYIGDPVSKN